MFGPPGSGKGTQSVTLAEKYNLLHLSTGDMLRAELAAGTPLGKKMEAIMASGELVPDDVVIDKRRTVEQQASAEFNDGMPNYRPRKIVAGGVILSPNTGWVEGNAATGAEITHRAPIARGRLSGT